MERLVKNISLVVLISMVILSKDNTLQAQSDAFFNQKIEERDTDYGFRYSSLTDENVFSFNLFDEDGFTFNDFENGNKDDGFSFGNFDYAPEEAPLEGGAMMLAIAGLMYVGVKRNRKE